MDYKHQDIEKHWQQWWKDKATYKVDNDTSKPKYYVLDMFPYPSGAGLHVGHPLGFIASDIFARYKTHQGFNVLHPMGVDAFGLPAEQYAIQTGQHPADTTEKNIKTFRDQLDQIGFCYDWERTVNTSDPNYHKWTQWIFLQLFKSWYDVVADKAKSIDELVKAFEAKGNSEVNASTNYKEEFTAEEWASKSEKEQQAILMDYRLAYIAYADVNWCPALGTVLANDEVKDGLSERGGHPVYRKSMRQWFLRITAYAQRLLDSLDKLDFSESLKEQQRNWIGRSEGATAFFDIDGHDEKLEIFTTRPDTIFGATFMVLAPEHPFVEQLTTPEQKEKIASYLDYVKSRSDLERQSEVKTVTGAFTGSYAINPLTNKKVPIWIAEYVLMGYGTGAIMAVPSDDDRDNAFAKKFGINIIDIIDKSNYPDSTRADKEGIMINSGFINGMEVPDAIEAVNKKLEEENRGFATVNYRIKDANFSRQRYWGEPFPIYYKDGVAYPVDEADLPLELPKIDNFKPTEEGEPPLGRVKDWTYNGNPLDLNTMPGFAGSSWYWLRYMDNKNDKHFVSEEAEQYWQNVDLYIGGAEHTVGHLLYSRFWQKFLFDTGKVGQQEPFKKLVNQGMIGGVTQFIYVLRPDIKNGAITETFEWHSDEDFIINNQQFKFDFDVDAVYISYDLVEKFVPENNLIKVRFRGAALVSNGKIGREVLEKFYSKDERVAKSNLIYITKSGYYHITDCEVNYYENFIVATDSDYYDFVSIPEPEKMSKSKFNTVNPDDLVAQYGADAFRMYEMFLGPLGDDKPWNTQGIDGVYRFVRKFWRLFVDDNGFKTLSDAEPSKDELKVLHKTIKKVNEDIEKLAFNTAVSTFMIAANQLTDLKCDKKAILQELVVLIAPFAPHIAEELWQKALGNEGSVTKVDYPKHDDSYLVESTYSYPINIGKKVRTKIDLPLDFTEEQVKEAVLADSTVQKWIDGKDIKRFIYVPGRIVNIVV